MCHVPCAMCSASAMCHVPWPCACAVAARRCGVRAVHRAGECRPAHRTPPARTIGVSMRTSHETDSRYAAFRLGVVLALMTIGSGAMYVVAVVLPAVQAEFGVARADASLPYTL